MSEFSDLRFEIRNLNTNVQSLIRATTQGEGASRSGRGAGGVTARDVGHVSDADVSGLEPSNLARLGRASLSAVSQVAQNAGPLGQGVSSIIGGFAAGGPLGAGIAALGALANVAGDVGRSSQRAALSAPLFASERRVNAERDFARTDAALDLAAQVVAPLEATGINDPGGVIATQRALREQRFRETEPVDRTAAQLGRFFGDLAAAGANVSDDSYRRIGKVLLDQNTRRVNAEAKAAYFANAINGSAPILPGQ